MSEDEIRHLVEGYLKKTERLLPSGFETEDLIEDLRSHIHDSFNDKVLKRPSEVYVKLINEVLDELGTPEEIAEQYGKEQLVERDKRDFADRWIYYTMRLTAAILVVVIASWIASMITDGAVDFNLAVIVLLFFAVLEWYVRTQQTKDA
ncbi:MAG: hypothetical protein ACFFE6_10165 [Candidatus Thorarchaeota archaeon]